MKKQIIHSLLLVIFFNYIMGCSLSDLELKNSAEIKQKEMIQSLVLKNMELITFDSNGGYLENKLFLEANLDTGKPIRIAKDDIKYYRVSEPSEIEISEIGGKSIREAKLKNNMYIIFNKNGGKIEENEFLAGVSLEGLLLKIKLEKVDKIYSEQGELITENDAITQTKKLKQIITKKGNYIYNFNEDSIKFIERTVATGITEN
ncbi:MAG: hypothetical protein WAR79_14285, partial [Melioribacteraceae bacterium]